MGIAARLAISFAAVAILAAAANLIFEQGVAVVETTRVDRGQFSPIPSAPSTLASAPSPVAPAARPSTATEALSDLDHLAGALERFQRSTEVRASVDSSASADELRAAAEGLEGAAKVVEARIAQKDSPPARDVIVDRLDAALLGYRQAGAAYVRSADARRSALQEYAGRVEAADRRVTRSMDGALKLFGRVITRQSLMRLHSDIEELRIRLAAVGAADTDQAGALEALTSSELAFAGSIHQHERGLSRSEGAEWIRQMREDIEQMATLRESILRSDAQLRDGAERLAAARIQAIAALPAANADPAPRAASRMQPRQAGAAPLPPTIAAPLPPAIASPVIGAVTTTTATRTTAPDARRRAAVACITGAVLLICLAISVWTVRSILVPVSRMLAATDRLANGDAGVRVPRGGMKELDTLAIAFNRMAAQLQAARDITQDYREHLESQVEQRTRLLQHLAEHDPLTLLANRRQFFVLLNQTLQKARERRSGVAVFFIDLDNFKNLNDGMGHAFGDRVLISVAQRLEETSSSFGFAARLGGDEFTVVHEGVSSLDDAAQAGRTLVDAFRRSLSVEGREITVSISVGASLYPDHELRAEDLLSAADAALFRAKALGRNQLAMFTRELLETASRKFTTEQGVRRALEYDEFELLFQPEVSMEKLQVGLVEALVRWRLPDGRLATPDEFLAVTEESGLIIELGDWVLRTAIETAAHWHHGDWPDVKIAINVSARQLLDQRFVERIQFLLREFRLPPRCIELELTESVLQTGAATIHSLRLLRSLDIAIALDDFGTGYSSLASLEQLPLSRIKLDRTLIAGIDTNPRSAAIAAALIRLCDDLGIEVTAEGVERDSQFGCLCGNRGMYLQGYLISRPVAQGEVLSTNRNIPQIMHDLLLSIPVSSSKPSPSRGRGARQDLTAGAAKL